MAALKDHTGQFLHALPFFSALPEEDMGAFMAAAKIRDYSKHQRLFTQGDPADRFFVVTSGWVKIYRITGEGEEAVTALFTRGDVFGEAAIFGGAVYPFSAEAAEAAHIIEIPSETLKTRAQANPDIMARIMQSMSREIHHLQIEHEHMALMSAPQRVGCLLLQLSSGMIGKGGTFTFPFDKSLAAARLGMKPETFSRALKDLKEIGVSVKGPEIQVENFACLVGHCCGDCSADSKECKGRREAACCGETTCPGKKQQQAAAH